MKLILIPLLLAWSLPILSEDPPVDKVKCYNLAKVFQEYNNKVQQARIKTTDASEAILADGSCAEGLMAEKILKTESEPKPTVQELTPKTCQSLAEIDLEISQVANKLNVIAGFKKLKSNILENLKKVKKETVKDSAKIFANDFVTGLRVAKNIELLMAEGRESAFLSALAVITDFKTSSINPDLKTKIKTTLEDRCKAPEIKSKQYPLCNPIPEFDDETIKSLQKIVEKDLHKKDLATWQTALSIKKAGSNEVYSFTKLFNDLDNKVDDQGATLPNQLNQISDKLDLSPAQITAIKSLPDFTSNQIFDFQNVKLEADRLSLYQDHRDFLKASVTRHELELKEKFVFFRAQLDQSAQDKFQKNDACKKPLKENNFESMRTCLGAFKPESNLTTDINLQKNLKALQTSADYISNLKGTISNCFDSKFSDTKTFIQDGDNNKVIPQCARGFIQENYQQEEQDLNKSLKSLEIVRKKILDQNKNDIIVRDFIQKKLKKECNKLINTTQSKLDCELPAGGPAVSKIANFIEFSWQLKGSTETIDVFSDEKSFLANPKDPCRDKSITFPSDDMKALICEVKSKSAREGPDPSDLTLQPPDGGHNSPARDAAIRGFGGALGAIASSLFQPTPNYNFSTIPSPYGFTSPYGYGYPMLSPSEQMLFEARYFGGYGNYWSTPGLAPYSSLGTSRMGRYWP